MADREIRHTEYRAVESDHLRDYIGVFKVDIACFGNLTPWFKTVIYFISFTRFFIPIRCPDAPSTCFFEGIVKSSDSTKEVDES